VPLTNHLKFSPNTISAIYKDRWQIELFFNTLKQNLKIKTFVGTTENALYIQIWTACLTGRQALIAMLLIKYLQFKNLFTYRHLWEWIDNPFGVLPLQPEPVQYRLPFCGIGQQVNNDRNIT